MADIRRQTAHKCSVAHVLNSKYVQQQGINPNYLNLNGLKVVRVNILGILVSKESNSLMLDDGSGSLQVMLFEDRLKNNSFSLGDLLLVIGKPREFEGKRFLVPEIIKVVENPKWLDFRKKELDLLDFSSDFVSDSEPVVSDSVSEVFENYHEKILSKIRELDKGEGAPYQDLVNSLKLADAEKKIEELLKEGEIFEVKGKIKIL